MKLNITLKASLLMALVCSSLSIAAQPTIDNNKIVLDRIFQPTASDSTEVILQQSDKVKGVDSYDVFEGSDWCKGPAYKTTLSLPSPARNLTCDATKHLFYIAGDDFVSISSDAATWYTSTKSVEVPFVNIGSDAKNYAARIFSTSEIPNKPQFIPSFVVIGSDSAI